MSRSICDVYGCRKDYFDANKQFVEKFAAGYIKACEELLDEQKQSDDNKEWTAKYKADLTLAKEIFGDEAIPSVEDADGLLRDCNMVLLPGNRTFFTDRRFAVGFEKKQKKVLDVGVALKNVTERVEFSKPDFDYDGLIELGGLKIVRPPKPVEFKGVERLLFSFEIPFPPNEDDFRTEVYQTDFQVVLDQYAAYGVAAIVIRGHVDPTLVLRAFVDEGMRKGTVQKTLQAGKVVYLLNNERIDLRDTKNLLQEIGQGQFEKAADIARQARTLSQNRANAVLDALTAFAESQQMDLDKRRFTVMGVGVEEPKKPVPTTWEEAKENMRVEFRLQTVPPEAKKVIDF